MTSEQIPTGAGLPSRGRISVSVVDGLPVPILVTRADDDRVIRVNPEFTAAYGHDNEAVTGLAARALHFAEDDRTNALTRQAEGEFEPTEVRLRSAADECCWAQADISCFEMDGQDVLLTILSDIRDLKNAEGLVEEMARFPDMNPGPVVRLDRSGTVKRCNLAAEELFGADVVGRCFWDLCPDFPVEDRERAFVDGKTVRVDVPHGDRWFRLTTANLPGSNQVFIFGTDITTEKVTEQELAERARFPAMNPGPVARLDADGIVLRANPAATALFRRESLQGLSWLDLCIEVDDELWNRVLDGNSIVQHEGKLDDRWFSFTLRHEPVANQVFVYGSDMTELKAAERALAELARFPDMNPGPVCRLDRDGVVLLANPAAKALFGSDEPAGLSWLDLVPLVTPDRWAAILDSSETTVIEAKIGSRDLVLTHAPGPEGLFVFVYGSDVTREKEAERALRQSEKMATLGTLAAGVAHELNNPAAAAQRAAEQLESSFAALQKVQLELGAAGLLDELGPVLATLDDEAREAASCGCDLSDMERADAEVEVEDWLDEHGFETPWEVAQALVEAQRGVSDLEALRDRVGPANVGRVIRFQAHTFRLYQLVEEVRHGSGRVSEIVGAMRAYSYLGQAPVQNVDVNEGIRNTLVILRSKLRAGITVEQELDPDLPRIEALGSELNQVWTNLLDNAVHAMEGEGTIRLRSAAGNGGVVIEVEDNGPGIPHEHQQRIFDAFFTTKPPGEGTGLGLHTTYNIVVEKHGGSIRVESEPGRTRFTVGLPLKFAGD